MPGPPLEGAPHETVPAAGSLLEVPPQPVSSPGEARPGALPAARPAGEPPHSDVVTFPTDPRTVVNTPQAPAPVAGAPAVPEQSPAGAFPSTAALPAAPAPGAPAPVDGGPAATAAPAAPQPVPGQANGEKPRKSTGRSRSGRRLRWPTIVFPLLFLLLAGIVMFLVLELTGVLSFTRPEVEETMLASSPGPNRAAREEARSQSIAEASHQRREVPTAPMVDPEPEAYAPVDAQVPPVEPRDLKVEGEVPPTPKIDLGGEGSPSAPALKASERANPAVVLDKFLKAKSLEERRPFMAPSSRGPEALASSSLATPLPDVINVRSLHYMIDDIERHGEHFFEVAFQRPAGQRPVPFLVQLNDWGEGDIRVHTDAFIEIFEDKLARFAANPIDGAYTFHVVADAYKHCFDEAIPGWDKKSFLKLRTHPRMAPKVHAYFNRASPIAALISRPNALPWGESGICTVTVKWNKDIPNQPFVELIKIDGFTWNP